MMNQALFFDFDGVILHSVDIKTQAFYEMFLPYGEGIAQQVVAHHTQHGGVSRFEKFKIYYNEYLHKTISEEEIQLLSKQFSALALAKVLNAPFIDGVVDFLENNYQKFDCYIISGTPEIELQQIVTARKLSKYFKGVFGSPKNKINILQEILNTNNYQKNESYFLGDALTDLEAAKHHHLKFILVKGKDNLYLEQLADIVIESFVGLKI